MNTRQLLSVGIDIGTTTTQVIFSRLELVNRAAVSQVPRYEFIKRDISWQSPVFFTPVDKQGELKEAELEALILAQYRAAGIAPQAVDSGAIIITGESAKTRNARPAVMALSQSLGDFVVASAGPHLESVIAGHGAGAQTLSRQRMCRVLNIDIGGGSSIDSVSFRDFNGDGRLEVAVGWRVSTEVQTVAVYELVPNQVNVLMQSGYLRYVVDDLDSDGGFDLLLIRSEAEGGCLAEHYVWQDGEMRVEGTCQLHCTPAELSRGSIVCGKLDSQKTAAFVTAVSAENTAMTNILLCRGGQLLNTGADRKTGITEVQYPSSQLRPQDINNDGIIEIPYPEKSNTRQASAFFAWYRFDERGNSAWVMDTYHDMTDGWYLVLNDDWHGKMSGTRLDAMENGTCVTLLVDGRPALYLYSLSGEERERDAQTGGRTLVMQRANVAYAMRITEDGDELGISISRTVRNIEEMYS